MQLPLRIGLLGCGRIVQRAHAPAYDALQDLVVVQALADPLDANRAQVVRRLAVPPEHEYADYRDMLAREELDIVVIATPHHLHAEHAVDALEAGVTVICEKPLASSLEEGEQILAAAAKAEVPVSVIHNFQFTPAVRRAQAWIRNADARGDAVGRALSLFRKSLDDLDPRKSWRARRTAGGGCLNDTAYHELYLLEALIGSPIQTVQGRVESIFGAGEVDDVVLLLLEHENGAVSTLSSSWGIPGAGGGMLGNLCEVHTRRGSVRIVRRGQELFQCADVPPRWERVPLPEMDGLPESDRRRIGHLNFFRETLGALARGERSLPVSGEQGWHMLALLEAARSTRPDRPPVRVSQRG